ncbi:MAG: Fe-S cluster assembly protein SufD [Anaerolineales bacterium]
MTIQPAAGQATPSKYQRTVITTARQKPIEPAPAQLTITKADVRAISALRKDAPWLARRRMEAWKAFEKLPMPSLTDDAWRRTDIRAFKWGEVVPGALEPISKGARRVPAALLKPLTGTKQGGLLVMAGHTAALKLDAALKRKQVVFTDFATATRKHADLLKKHLGKTVAASDGKFAALAATLGDTGLFIYIPKGVQVDLPLHSVAWLSSQAHFSRVVIVVDDGSSVTVVHEIASPAAGAKQALHAGTVEITVGKGAHLTFVELQSLGENVWNFTHERARVHQNGKLDWIFSAVGSRLTKNFSQIDLDGDGAGAKMSGFYFGDNEQHLDHDTQQNHNAPHTTSDLLFKGALRGQSRSVWQGMIYVARGAQKADGYQANRNLVLSRGARADSIPGLEILADDVRCTHGATVGQLDEEQIFYVLSRGLPRAEAEKVVVDGFFDPVLQRIPFAGVRDRLKSAIESKMG